MANLNLAHEELVFFFNPWIILFTHKYILDLLLELSTKKKDQLENIS